MSHAFDRALADRALAERFCAELVALGGEAQIAENDAEAANMVVSGLQGWQASAVVATDDLAAQFPAVAQALAQHGITVHIWASEMRTPQDLADVPAGVLVADWAIAATGTIAFAASRRQGRTPSLLPPAIVVLTPATRLLAERARLFAALREQAAAAGGPDVAKYPSGLSLVTGPSRTADIESDLSIGVHGPGRVLAVVVMKS